MIYSLPGRQAASQLLFFDLYISESHHQTKMFTRLRSYRITIPNDDLINSIPQFRRRIDWDKEKAYFCETIEKRVFYHIYF